MFRFRYRGLENQSRVPVKGFFKGMYKGSIVGFYGIGALIMT